MNSSARSLQILGELAEQLPVLLTILVCMGLLVWRWRRHPAVCGWGVTGLALLLLHAPVFTVLYAWTPEMLPASAGPDDFRNLFLILGLIFNTTKVIAYAPLMVAIFMKRSM